MRSGRVVTNGGKPTASVPFLVKPLMLEATRLMHIIYGTVLTYSTDDVSVEAITYWVTGSRLTKHWSEKLTRQKLCLIENVLVEELQQASYHFGLTHFQQERCQ